MDWFNESSKFIAIVQQFIFLYPFFMSLIWISGALIFSFYRERHAKLDFNKYKWPKISILVPCYNEEDTIEETIKYLSRLSYPEFEIIAVNDGSKDNTGNILVSLADKYSMLRVIDCHENRGKANALHMAAHASTSEYLLCIDSDAILDDKAPYYLIKHFLEKGERVGAVTGNPRIRNRDTLLGKMQLVEYSSIIGSIKRTQRIMGKVMTVSGVIVAFRKKALFDVGLWDRDMITEDIAVSWKLQKRFWDIRYEPQALCWMLVPETLVGIWKQRVRWSQGGQEVVLRHWDIFTDWRQRRLWPIYIEQVLSILWAFAWFLCTLYLILTATSFGEIMIWFTFTSFALVLLSHIQLIISLRNDSRYDNTIKYYLWAAWYPALYWMINTLIVIAATPKAIMSRIKGGYATWSSPDRGKRSNQ
ncbi:poly-beta-1,6 N-acetyl-D-glucosamine synthase [Romboutsia weinsteinii]|uniref:Poly-beta-1,6-N-acetyl-D-glucosamine synthase n=2 Tax=Romboutsia weinsteinii TaxID=2020949 RepID=A0A371J6B9_9FIRM|nr:poly-beta-1,6 N-acetyl-D-glucosamine synthase [Romboutsia weinsteinii]